MDLNNFQDYIDPVIVDRWFNYFITNNVEHLEENVPGVWQSRVFGSVIYSVKVRLDGDRIEDWSCNCPYDHGPVCKHVVALLYAIEKEMDESTAQSGINVRFQDGMGLVQDIFSKASKNDLQDFIVEMIKSDAAIKHRFIAHFAEFIEEEDPTLKYRKLIRNYSKAAEDRYGFIDYYSASTLTDPLYDLNEKAESLLESGKTAECLAICKSVIEEVSGVMEYIDDSNGAAGDAVFMTFETIHKVVKNASDELKDDLFNWCMTEYSLTKYNDFGYDHYLLNLMPELIVRPEQEANFFERIDQQIDAMKEKDYSDYGVTELLKAKISYLNKQNRENEVEELIESYSHIVDFRMMRVDRAIESKDHQKARELSLEGISLAQQKHHHGIVSLWHEKLFNIARLEEDVSSMRKWAEFLFIENYYSMKWYRQLKAIWPKKEWPEKCEALIERIKGEDQKGWRRDATTLADIFVEEGYTERLLKLVQHNSWDIEFVRSYAGYLSEIYPYEILNFFEEGIKKRAMNTGRKHYQQIASWFKEMSKIKGGDEQAYTLVKKLLRDYQNRPAMKDEFGKVFPKWVHES